jgi:hypothetical protein
MAWRRHLAPLFLLALLGPAMDAREGWSSQITLTLHWTAPGDDGMVGQSTAYDVRVSNAPISESNFKRAAKVAGFIYPGLPGTTETMVVSGLTPGTDYYFAVKTQDDAGNWSPISNVAVWSNSVLASEPPIIPLEFTRPWPNPARSEARFTLSMPRDGPVRVDVFDVRGRRVGVLAAGLEPAGSRDLVWNLTDMGGSRVSAGLYLVRAQIDGTTITRRVTVVH